MPTQRRGIGLLLAFLGNMDSFAVHGVIVPAVVELLFDPPTDLEIQVGCHRHVSGVQQAVDVSPQQKPVARLMLPAFTVRPDIRGLERWERALLCHSTSSLVDVRHQHTECALSETRPDEMRLAEAIGRRLSIFKQPSAEAIVSIKRLQAR